MKFWIVCVLLFAVFMPRTASAAAIETEPKQDQQLPVETTEHAVEELIAAVQDNEKPLKSEAAAKNRSGCPFGWYGHGTRCFRVMRSQMTWIRAEAQCKAEKARLVSVHDRAEYAALQNLLNMVGMSSAWTGAFYFQGSWLWVDSTLFSYTNWHSQSNVPSYPCAYMLENAGWVNTDCNKAYPFICTIDLKTC